MIFCPWHVLKFEKCSKIPIDNVGAIKSKVNNENEGLNTRGLNEIMECSLVSPSN